MVLKMLLCFCSLRLELRLERRRLVHAVGLDLVVGLGSGVLVLPFVVVVYLWRVVCLRRVVRGAVVVLLAVSST